MKVKKLVVDYNYNFTLLAIIAPVREYKLAWKINQQLDIKLIKCEDLWMNFLKNEQIVISNYKFETPYFLIRLLKNRSCETGNAKTGYLVPELKKFDYLVTFSDESEQYSSDEVLSEFKQINEVQFITQIDIDQLKSKENLIF